MNIKLWWCVKLRGLRLQFVTSNRLGVMLNKEINCETYS